MILFYDLKEIGSESIADKLPLPRGDALEIMAGYADEDAEVAISGAFGCLLVRIYDGGEYLFSYPYPLTESADEAGAVEEIALYALREGLPLVFFDVPRDSLPVLLMGFRHADVDAEDEYAETELAAYIDEFLDSLSKTNRMLFVRRFWYMDSYEDIANASGLKEGAIRTRLSRIKSDLKLFLEKRGVIV